MSDRLEVLKTYKIYIGGKFPRTESGRYYIPTNSKGEGLCNACLGSRKDFRNAVVAARKAHGPWAERSAYNIGQILYRIAENLEGRKEEFIKLIQKEEAISTKAASKLVEDSIDQLVYFAGWSDKFQQLFSSVNPVASSHFNFSILEGRGVVAALLDADTSFKDLVTVIAVAICSGNSIVLLAKENAPLSGITFAEVLQHSDLPGGVVNILTGKAEELEEHFATHMDVNTLLLVGNSARKAELAKKCATNLKRLVHWSKAELKQNEKSPYLLKDLLETKTTWHPIEQIGGAKSGY